MIAGEAKPCTRNTSQEKTRRASNLKADLTFDPEQLIETIGERPGDSRSNVSTSSPRN
jgi:hypothetical protein